MLGDLLIIFCDFSKRQFISMHCYAVLFTINYLIILNFLLNRKDTFTLFNMEETIHTNLKSIRNYHRKGINYVNLFFKNSEKCLDFILEINILEVVIMFTSTFCIQVCIVLCMNRWHLNEDLVHDGDKVCISYILF